MKLTRIVDTGVCHADDLGYIFKSNLPTGPPQMSELPDDAPEIQMVASLTAVFSQFAATGYVLFSLHLPTVGLAHVKYYTVKL